MAGCLSIKPNYILPCLFLLLVCTLASCRDQADTSTTGFNEQSLQCLGCHQVELDQAHQLECLTCHLPTDSSTGYPETHTPVIASPAHPDYAPEICGPCHAEEVEMVAANNHYLLSGHISLITNAFGNPVNMVGGTPETGLSSYPTPETEDQLVQDLLVRRCLRCHVYNKGDDFSAVTRGIGCAACHLSFKDGQLTNHVFSARPSDLRCLSCHYGNHVGFDYYGFYEQDLNEEYRTPYLADTTELREYGVEHHNLAPDVHQRAGLVCIDCHRKDNVMGHGDSPRCTDCHFGDIVNIPAESQLKLEDNKVIYISAATTLQFEVPRIQHPAHTEHGNRFSCQACHAQWSYNDSPTHLLRIDHDFFDDFYKLSLDGSSEVLNIISSHILDDGDLLEPHMTNKFTGANVPGIWFRGFGERRWEQVLLEENVDGTVVTVRPILDLRLSWIDEYEESRFDNLEPVEGVIRSLPYAPHTIGKAGLFYESRIRPVIGDIETDSALICCSAVRTLTINRASRS